MRKTMSDRGVAALKPRAQRYAVADPELRGHWIRVQPSGMKSFVAVTRSPQGRQLWATVGTTDAMAIADAREQARAILQRVRAGLPPVEAPGETFADVAANWIKRHVEPNGLRSHYEIARLLDRHVLPKWRDREFLSIKRNDVAVLLDHIEDNVSARQADACLTIVRSIAHWYAARANDYQPPFVRGMRRQSQAAQSRARVLDDDEIRAIWKQAEGNGTFGAIIRLCLLTAQRRAKVASMRWADVSIDGEWNIPVEPREKGNAGFLMLPKIAVDIVGAQPRVGANPFVFAGLGAGHFKGYSKAKERFDAKLADVKPWVLHDLRRSGRSLMARAGVRPDVAERVMGHAVAGVEGVYDRYSYRDEKRDALARLAALIATILNPSKGNVRPIRRAAR